MAVNAKNGRICCINELLILSLLGNAGSDILPDANHAHNVPRFVSSRGGVEEDVDPLAPLGDDGELKVGHLAPLQRLGEHLLHGDLVVVRDELLHQLVPDHVLLGVVGHVAGLVVPHVHNAVDVDAEDGRVGGVDQPLVLLLLGDAGRDVLPDANDADDGARLVPAGGGVEQDVHLLPTAGDDGELVVRHFHAHQGLIQHLLHRGLVVISDVFLHQLLAQHFGLGVARHIGGLLVPHIDNALFVNAKNGCIGCVDELLVLSLLGNTGSDILPNTNDTNDCPSLISARSGVKQNVNSLVCFGHDRELEVRHLKAIQGIVEHILD
mmetsp:Transcript_5718/g.9876  ORF Transcript_5718/g.9876 Transcript_5718/m.9876 type:complete len:323 (-) Transcript_5718:609-1577(-)